MVPVNESGERQGDGSDLDSELNNDQIKQNESNLLGNSTNMGGGGGGGGAFNSAENGGKIFEYFKRIF